MVENWRAASCLLLNSSLLGTGSFALPRFFAFPDRTRPPSAPQVPGRSIPVAAGVDGGLGELLFRMMGFTDSLQSELQAGLCFATARCNCSSWVLGPLHLGLRQRFALAAFPHCCRLLRCLAGQDSSQGRNSAQKWPFIVQLRARTLLVWCLPPRIPYYYTEN